jgi:membrane associated rhomboid family serine protease
MEPPRSGAGAARARVSGRSRAGPPLLTLALVGVALLLLAAPELAERLAFERARLAREPWRFLTGHLVHARAVAAADLVVLGLLGAWWERRSRPVYAAILLASAGLASLAVACFTGFARYTGSSALSSGLLVAAALVLALEEPYRGTRLRLVGVLALGLFGAKVALEAAGYGSLFVELSQGLQVAASAHAAGGAGGALVVLAARRRTSTAGENGLPARREDG